MKKKYWYAQLQYKGDEWGTGTFSKREAIKWLKRQDNDEAFIAVIDGGYNSKGELTTDPICIEEITIEDVI